MDNVQVKDERKPITLTGAEVYEKLRVIMEKSKEVPAEGEEEAGTRTWAVIGFSDCDIAFQTDVEFAKLLTDYDLFSVTLRPSSFERPQMAPDAEGILQPTGNKETVFNYVYGGHMTLEGKEKLDEKLDKIKQIAERSEDRKAEREFKYAAKALANIPNEPELVS